jgi:hypothetical protein
LWSKSRKLKEKGARFPSASLKSKFHTSWHQLFFTQASGQYFPPLYSVKTLNSYFRIGSSK